MANRKVLNDILTTQGDIPVRGIAGSERLPIGTAEQILRVNSGATGLEYVTLNTINRTSDYTVAAGKSVTAQKIVQMLAGGVADYEFISGSTITPGTPAVFESASTNYISVAMLTSTKAIVTYKDGGNSNYGTACVLDISGSTITPGTPAVFESATTDEISVAMLTSTKAIVTYKDGGNSNYGTVCILNITASTITPITPIVFESVAIGRNSTTTITPNQSIVCYRDSSNNKIKICILNISANIITPMIIRTITTISSVSYISASTLTETKIIITYNDTENSNYGTACILDTVGTIYFIVFESAITKYTSVTTLTSTKAIVCYEDDSNSDKGTSCILNIINDTLTAGTPVIYEDAATSWHSVAQLTSTKAIVSYTDEGNSNRGTTCILDIEPTTPTNFIGVGTETKAAGETVAIAYGDEIDGFTGLTAGTLYYIADDGTLTDTVENGHQNSVCVAISTTKVKWFGGGEVIIA